MITLVLLLSSLPLLLGCDPQNCIKSACHYEKATPHCTYGCKPGYAGNICKEHCDNICFTCERYNIRRCTGCFNGHFGSKCENQCTDCQNLRCFTNGTCCEHSRSNETCDDSCPTGCPEECDPGECSEETTSTSTPTSPRDSPTTSTVSTGNTEEGGYPEDVHGNKNCIDVTNDETACTRGCQPGYHGSFCNETCSEHCSGACSQDTGHCLTGCKPNWFTSNCSQPCSGNCVDNVCDRRSAECIRGCKDGFYGLNCNETCSGNCIGGTCDINGGCECEKDLRDEACYINCEDCVGGSCAVSDDGQPICPRGCKDEQIGSFCKELASCDARPECQSLRIRDLIQQTFISETENCHEEEEHGQCTCCKEGWRGTKCDIPCPPCRYNYRDGCSIACAGGFFGEECHLDCPADCSRSTNGKSRCDENGVCDSGCLQGNYGYVCDHKCPSTCLARTCFMNNGSCTEGCVPGRWGTKCQYQCGHCVDLICGRDGSCTCEDEYFGPRCQHRCSDHCVSGLCFVDIGGNHVCEGECQPSYTGLDCLSRCPRDCYNDHCDKESGICDAEGDGGGGDGGGGDDGGVGGGGVGGGEGDGGAVGGGEGDGGGGDGEADGDSSGSTKSTVLTSLLIILQNVFIGVIAVVENLVA